MIYGKELEKYIREMERLSKEARAKSQDPKTRAPRKYAMLSDDYKLRAEIAREAQESKNAVQFVLAAEGELARIAREAEEALEKLDKDPERPSRVEAVLKWIIKFSGEFAEWEPYEKGDTDGKT